MNSQGCKIKSIYYKTKINNKEYKIKIYGKKECSNFIRQYQLISD